MDVNQNNIGFTQLGVTQRTQVLFDDVEFAVPQQSIVINNILNLDGAPSGISQINQYSQRFSQVPIPPAVWLLGSGLVGLSGLKRRFKF